MVYVRKRYRRDTETFNFRLVSDGIESEYDFQQSTGGTDSPQVLKDNEVTRRDSAQQTAPWEMNVQLVSDAVQFRRQVFNRRLNEQNVRRAAL